MVNLIDSHVHLFDKSNIDDLTWITEDNKLYKEHTIREYLTDNETPGVTVDGIIFNEVDVKGSIDSRELPLKGFKMVTKMAGESEGLLKSIIPWAPLPLGPDAMREYFQELKESCGAEAFKRLKGFRCLLQDKPRNTMLDSNFIESLNWMGQEKLVFDLGIDLRSTGLWQFVEFCNLLKQTRDVRYIINHLTKPNLRFAPQNIKDSEEFQKWEKYKEIIALDSNNESYMKLSGGFSELAPDISNSSVEECCDYILPWFEVCYKLWGADRIIFGSDWPVCNLNMLESPTAAIAKWINIVELLFDKVGLDEGSRKKFYRENCINSYNL